MNNTETCIDTCNKLLRGELSAIETYHQALEKIDSGPEADQLNRILQDHEKSAGALRAHITDMGAIPDSESGAWGTFAKAVEGTAKMFGERSAIMALKQGEEHGISEYEEALNSPDVMQEAKATIRGTLLPRLREHVSILEGLPS